LFTDSADLQKPPKELAPMFMLGQGVNGSAYGLLIFLLPAAF